MFKFICMCYIEYIFDIVILLCYFILLFFKLVVIFLGIMLKIRIFKFNIYNEEI